MYSMNPGAISQNTTAAGSRPVTSLRLVTGDDNLQLPASPELRQKQILAVANNFGIKHGYLAINGQGAWVVLAKGFANNGYDPITYKVADVSSRELNLQAPQQIFSSLDKLFGLKPDDLLIDKVFVEADQEAELARSRVDGLFISTRMVSHNDTQPGKPCDVQFNYYLPGVSRDYLQEPVGSENPELSRIVFHTQQIMRGDREYQQQTFRARN